jgi:hypothetical protein
MKRIALLFCTALTLVTGAPSVYAYLNKFAHPKINEVIIEELKKRLPAYSQSYNAFKKFEKYHFGMVIGSLRGTAVLTGGNEYITEGPDSKTPEEWVKHGGYSADEPEWFAALRHFYDPLQNNGHLYLTDLSYIPNFVNPSTDAVQWAFTGVDPSSGGNKWTWDVGKESMKAALEISDSTVSDEYMAAAMRCLGEVLHNTGDMGLPAHVRNDAHGGYWVAGGADPYESSYKPEWTATYGAEKADPALASFFRSATQAIDINDYLSKFTNKYFFSHETISGEGVKHYTAINGYPDYPSPKLENFTYRPESFGYFTTFPSGREVEMCMDQSLFLGYISSNFRAQPRVDLKCIQSQATELIPDIVEAGINVVRLFIPQLAVSIEVDGATGDFTGTVTHTPDAEYTSTINYGGYVRVWVNANLMEAKFPATTGSFSGHLDGLKDKDAVKAVISFADIAVNSPVVTVSTEAAPVITSVTPDKGGSGTMVSVHGKHFSYDGTLYFENRVTGTYEWTDTLITFAAFKDQTIGAKEIYVNVLGTKSNVKTFTFIPAIKSVTITPTTGLIPVGGSVQLQATAIDEEGSVVTDRPITWRTYASSILSVSNTGNVTGLAPGSGTVMASCDGWGGEAIVCVFDPTSKYASSGKASGFGGLELNYTVDGMVIDEYTDWRRSLAGWPMGSTVTVTMDVKGPYSIEGSWATWFTARLNGVVVESERAPDNFGAAGWTHACKPIIVTITNEIKTNGFSISASVDYARSSNAEDASFSLTGKGCK